MDYAIKSSRNSDPVFLAKVLHPCVPLPYLIKHQPQIWFSCEIKNIWFGAIWKLYINNFNQQGEKGWKEEKWPQYTIFQSVNSILPAWLTNTRKAANISEVYKSDWEASIWHCKIHIKYFPKIPRERKR